MSSTFYQHFEVLILTKENKIHRESECCLQKNCPWYLIIKNRQNDSEKKLLKSNL